MSSSSLSIWSSTKLSVASLPPLEEILAVIRRVASSSSFLLGRMSGQQQQQPTTWYAYYSERAGREYYHDPVRGVSTWILPDDEHENPLDYRFRTIIRRRSPTAAQDADDASTVSYMRFLAMLFLIVPLCWNSMSSSSSHLAEEIETMNISLDNDVISEAVNNWESLHNWDVPEEEEEVAEYFNVSDNILVKDVEPAAVHFAKPVAPPSLQEDFAHESELVEKPKERLIHAEEEKIIQPKMDLDLGASKQILEWLEMKMAQSGYVVARVEPSQVPIPAEPVLVRPPSPYDDSSNKQKKRLSFRYNCNLPLARVFQKRCRDQKVDMDAEQFAHEMMV